MNPLHGAAVIAATLVLAAPAVSAESGRKPLCSSMASLSEEIMNARFAGVPRYQAIQTAEREPLFEGLAKRVIEEAYSMPLDLTPPEQAVVTKEVVRIVRDVCLNP